MLEFEFSSHGAGMIHAYRWEPEGQPRGVVQIIHGIAEYVPRYAGFAAFLNAHGLLVTGEDHMGHGKSHGTEPCHFSGGWCAAVDDSMELLRRTKEGDMEAREQLIAGNLRLVLSVIQKFSNRGENLDDLFQVGCIGLIKAINTFKVDKKIKLATYASRCIENEILMYLRRNSKTRMEVSIDEPLNVDWDGNELLLSDILGTDEDVIYHDIETDVEHRLLKTAIGKLSGRERMIIELRFGLNSIDGEEKTQKEVADMLGISQSYISRLEKKIMKRLKKEIVRYE